MSTKTIKSVPLSTQGQPLGVATLDASGKVPVSQLPAISSAVSSVNGLTGAVVVDKNSIGLGNVDNTSDANKPLSSADVAALNGKAPTIHTHPLSAITQSGAATGQVPQWNGTNYVPATISGSGQIQSDWTQTNTASLDFIKNKPTLTSANIKLPTIIVATSGGDYNNLQAALDVAATTYPAGCLIWVKNGNYTISTTLLLKSDNVYVYCESRSVQFNVSASTFIKAQLSAIGPNTGVGRLYCRWDGSLIQNNNAATTGIAFDTSNWGVCQTTERTFVIGFKYSQWIKDTNNQSFYSRFKHECFDVGYAVYVDPLSLPVNFNIWEMPEVGLNGLAAGNTGFYLNNMQNNTFIHCAVEPFGGGGTFIANTTGFKFGVGCVHNLVIQCYVEACQVGVQDSYANYSTAFGVDSQGGLTELSKGNQFIGGNVSGNGTELSNTGNIMFQNTMVNYWPYNLVKIGTDFNSPQTRPPASQNNKSTMWFDHSTNKMQFSDGTTWRTITSA
jgi:hypothetical protein